MKKNIEVKTDGINFNKEVMDNGELRIRLTSQDNSAYIRTEAGDSGAWQNSHYHTVQEETYIVQKGWLGFAELVDGKLRLKVLPENSPCTAKPLVSHNIYLPANAIIHTIKHGRVKQPGWLENKELDTLTKNLSEKDIKKIASE